MLHRNRKAKLVSAIVRSIVAASWRLKLFAKVWNLAQHQWIVYLTYAWIDIVYMSTRAISYSVLGCLFG